MSGETAQSLARKQTEFTETNAELKSLKTVLQRPGQIGGFDSPELKKQKAWDSYNKALRMGWGSLDADEKKAMPLMQNFSASEIGHGQAAEYKAMYSSDATTGGFLMMPEVASELILAVVQISDFHSLVNVRMTANPWVIIRKRTQTTSASRIPEQATRTETQNMKFGRVQVFPYTAYALSKISNEDLEDSELDLPSTILADFAEEFARLEGWEIPNGLGAAANQCAGFLNDTGVTGTAYPGSGNTQGYLTSSATGGFAYQDLIDTKQALKPAYRKGSTWACTTETVGDLQKLTDSIGHPLLWDANGAPTGQLLGYPYQEMVDMSQVASGNFPLIIANWKKFYTLVIRKQVSVRVIQERYIDENAVGYMGYYRFGGEVTLSEAAHALKIA
jgi:HK97 family phage major capsid protein